MSADGEIMRLGNISEDRVRHLLALYDLTLATVPAAQDIPGSFWGDCEAGLIGATVYARPDTPVHSILHEACHLMVMPAHRRATVHTDATDSAAEEDAACYLQLLLSDCIPGFGFDRACRDMDHWGYSFRLGSAKAWFRQDAEDALAFLRKQALFPLPAPVRALQLGLEA